MPPHTDSRRTAFVVIIKTFIVKIARALKLSRASALVLGPK